MTINEKLKELKIYLEMIFPEGINNEEDKKLVIKRFEKNLEMLEINNMIKKHNKFIGNLWNKISKISDDQNTISD